MGITGPFSWGLVSAMASDAVRAGSMDVKPERKRSEVAQEFEQSETMEYLTGAPQERDSGRAVPSSLRPRFHRGTHGLLSSLRPWDEPDTGLNCGGCAPPGCSSPLRACADRLATFHICRFSELSNRLLIAH